MEVRRGFKLTEAGAIPEDWAAVLLDSVAKRGSGHTPDKKHPEYWNGNIKWVSLADSDRLDTLYIHETAAHITPAGIANSSATLHPTGTVVLSRDAGVGKSAIMSTPMAVSQHFMAWQCGPRLDKHFLYYWLQSQKREFERIAVGNTIKTIGLPYFRNLFVPLPPFEEQRQIASAMMDADRSLIATEDLINKKRNIKLATMQSLLSGRTRLPGHMNPSRNVLLGDVGKFVGGSGFPVRHQGALTGSYPFFKVSDMNNRGNELFMTEANNWISEEVRTQLGAVKLPQHCIVFAKVGAAVFLERKRILVRESCVDNNMAAFVPNTALLDPLFAYDVLVATKLSALATTTALPSLSGKTLAQLRLQLPSLNEQRAIAEVLSDMDAEITALEAQRDKTKALKQAMMQELLTGRTRLV